jgi:subtilisin-like proprotein convertase family protein
MSNSKTLAGCLVIAALFAASTVPTTAVAAKHSHQKLLKKKKGGGTFTNASPVGLSAATNTAYSSTSAKATSTIKVPRKKKALIKDVNVGVRLNVNSPAFTTAGITLLLVAPNGQTQFLLADFQTGGEGTEGTGLGNGPSNCSSGTMRFDDQAHREIISSVPPTQPSNPYSESPDAGFAEFTAFPPYAVSVQPVGFLGSYKGAQAKGIWSLVLLNSSTQDSSTLLCWQLRIKPEKVTKKKNQK